jgi:hypothetical protein
MNSSVINAAGGGSTETAPGSSTSLYSAWIKSIDLSKELRVPDFSLASNFRLVANIVADTKETRQTVIEFVPTIPLADWKKQTEWIYLLTIDERIVKIGGTRDSLKGRTGSYLCGHHIPERGKSRDCSKTNGFIYNTFDHYIQTGHSVQMWGFEVPAVEATVEIWGETKTIRTQVYTAYETHALELYHKEAGAYPALSDNSDPTHRETETRAKKEAEKAAKAAKKAAKEAEKAAKAAMKASRAKSPQE